MLEYLNGLRGALPEGVTPTLGPDATGIGWVFQYTLTDKTGKHGLDDLRTFQDFTLRYALGSVPGVAEVASVGGYQKQYQVTVDPNRLRAYGVTLSEVIDAIRQSNNDVGGRILEFSGREYYVRGRGYIKDLGVDREDRGSRQRPSGTPLLVKDVATVRFGPDIRRGLLEWNGEGEAVGGIVVMRYGENALDVIERVKKKFAELKPSFPAGVEMTIAYDRSSLIERSIDTLKHALLEEAIVVSLVIMLFLLHLRSSLLPILSLPISVALSFIPMYLLDIPSTIMSLGGIAIAIGATVDAEIVMIEASHKKLEHAGPGADRHKLLAEAAREVTPAIFFSLLIIAVAFLPVFSLTGQAGRLFKPLAYTKTFVMLISALLSITFAPALRDILIRGKIRPEKKHPVSRFIIATLRAVRLRRAAPAEVDDRHRPLRAGVGGPDRAPAGQRVHAAAERGRPALHADHLPEHLHRGGEAAAPVPGPHAAQLPRGRDRVRQGRAAPRRATDPAPHHDGRDDGAASSRRASGARSTTTAGTPAGRPAG